MATLILRSPAQAPLSDYATATIRFTVPASFGAVCSGEPAQGSPVLLPSSAELPDRRVFVFAAQKPLRYLSCVVSRFAGVETRHVNLEGPPSSNGDNALPIHMTSTARRCAACPPRDQANTMKKRVDSYINRLGLEGASVDIARGHKIRFRRGDEPIVSGMGPGFTER